MTPAIATHRTPDSPSLSVRAEWLVLVLGLALCALLVLPRIDLEIAPLGDNPEYYLRALSLATGQGFVALEVIEDREWTALITPPALPLFLGASMSIFGATMVVAKITFFVGLYLSLVAVYLAFRGIDRRLALGVTTLIAFQPFALSWSPFLFTDLPFIHLSLVGCALGYRYAVAGQRSLRLALGLGALLGVMVLTRYIGIAFIAGWVAWLGLQALKSRQRRVWQAFTIGTAGAVLPVIGLAVWLTWQDPGFVSRYLGGVQSIDAQGAPGPEPEVSIRDAVRRHTYLYGLALWTGMIYQNFQWEYEFEGWEEGDGLAHLDPLVTTVGVLFLIGVWSRRRGPEVPLLLAVGGIYGAVLLLSPYDELRYLLPLVALAIPHTVVGVAWICDRAGSSLGSERAGRRTAFALVTLLVLWSGARSIPLSWQCQQTGTNAQFRQHRIEYREVSRWISKHYQPPTVVFGWFQGTGRVYSGLPNQRMWVNEPPSSEYIARYDDPLIIRDAANWRTEKHLDPWLEQHREALTEVYRLGDTAVFQVDSAALLSP